MSKNLIPFNLQLLASQEKTVEDQLLELQDKLINIENERKKDKDTINNLLLKNQEYFLKITSNKTEEKTEEIDEYTDYVGKEFFNSLTNKEQKQLITILEGEDE